MLNTELALRIVKNFKRQYPYKELTWLYDQDILSAFSWRETDEGYGFWYLRYRNRFGFKLLGPFLKHYLRENQNFVDLHIFL